jgi:drug/metabolite transporter (DMT)-like permease
MSKGVGFMLISTFAFSLMQLCVKFLPHLPTHELILFRSLVSLVLSLGFLVPRRISPWGNNRKLLVLRGVFGMLALSLFFVTLQELPLASAVTIQYLSPIFTSIFAIFLLKERMRPRKWVFIAIAFAGVVVLKGFDDRVSTTYFLLGILSALFAGGAYNCIRLLRGVDHPVVVVFYFPLIAAPVMAVLSFYDWVMPQDMDWVWLLLLGIFTQVGQVYMTKALQAENANIVTSMKYLGAVYALLYGYFLFDETYGLLSLIGIGMVLLGVVLNVLLKEKPTDATA